MSTPQRGVFIEGTAAHHHLELALTRDVSDAAVRRGLSALLDTADEALARDDAHVVIGAGPALWNRLTTSTALPHLRPFAPVGTPGHGVPTTQRDLWVWVHGSAAGVALDHARAAARALASVASIVSEQAGWPYRDLRDLTGFQDGTENPAPDEAPAAALVADGDPGAGGAYAITMRWVHNLDAWEKLAVAEQESIIGRTKPDSVQLDDAVRPDTAHVSRMVVEEDGGELEIYRRSIPYGTVAEHGLYFVAFSADPHRFDRMLDRMYGVEDGITDRLTEFTRPVSASAWFVPSVEDLTAVARGER